MREVVGKPEAFAHVSDALAEAVVRDELAPRQVLGREGWLGHLLQVEVHLARTLLAAQPEHAPARTDVRRVEQARGRVRAFPHALEVLEQQPKLRSCLQSRLKLLAKQPGAGSARMEGGSKQSYLCSYGRLASKAKAGQEPKEPWQQ